MSEKLNTSRAAPPFRPRPAPAQSDAIPSSSPAFGTPVHPIRPQKPVQPLKPSILPVQLPPATLRPLAFRTFTKKHNLTLTSSALQTFAAFIGKHCGVAWREDGLAERILDDIAKSWKKNGGGVIVPGEGEDLKNILRNIESSLSEGKSAPQDALNRQGSFVFGAQSLRDESITPGELPGVLSRDHSQGSLGLSTLEVDDDDDEDDNDNDQTRDPRQWLKVIGAFEQPRLMYNWTQKHFELIGRPPSLLPDPAQKTHLFRHRYNLIHQRLLRNESFQTSTVGASRTSTLQRSSSIMTTAQQAYKLTPIANLLGRSGSNHLILGLLTLSPTGALTISDLTGSIALDIGHARPVPEGGAWFTPGMVVLVDGMYEEEGSAVGPAVGADAGIGGTIGGKFIGFSVGGPPCERRDVTLGVGNNGAGNLSAGAGFGWVDFLGVGSERGSGTKMRRLEQRTLKRGSAHNSTEGRGRMVIMGEVDLASANVLQAMKKILGVYAAEPSDESPMIFVLMGNFARYAVMAGGGSGGSIEYKEYFDSLATALSDYPSVLQSATFIFVPGDNDPWASAFSAGAATALPRASIPDIFTSRVKRAFATANAEADSSGGERVQGKAIWSTNPARITLFGPAQEVVLFRDDMTGRLLRNSLTFRPLNGGASSESACEIPESTVASKNSVQAKVSIEIDIDAAVETAESHLPAAKTRGSSGTTVTADLVAARRLVKTILDQGYLSPFPLSIRPVLWDYSGALQLYPLPSALVLMDPEAPAFAITYEGCHVMNPGPLVTDTRRGVAQWMEYDARTRRGKTREIRF